MCIRDSSGASGSATTSTASSGISHTVSAASVGAGVAAVGCGSSISPVETFCIALFPDDSSVHADTPITATHRKRTM